jgi:hypothetical protein
MASSYANTALNTLDESDERDTKSSTNIHFSGFDLWSKRRHDSVLAGIKKELLIRSDALALNLWERGEEQGQESTTMPKRAGTFGQEKMRTLAEYQVVSRGRTSTHLRRPECF